MLLKMKKERMVKTYVEGRESMDDPYAIWGKEEAQKENFSLFAQPEKKMVSADSVPLSHHKESALSNKGNT
jgi:hypothetical protein